MSTPRMPKMSLAAQFDDICRYSAALQEGYEDDFIAFVNEVQTYIQNLSSAKKEIEDLKEIAKSAQHENQVLETKLKHLRCLFDTELKRRVRAEEERNCMERQISLIREVLLTDQNALNDQTKEKLAFLSSNSIANKNPQDKLETIDESVGSYLSSSDISFDKTDDDLEIDEFSTRHFRANHSKGKRTSNHGRNYPEKKRKSQEKFDAQGRQTSFSAELEAFCENGLKLSNLSTGPAMNTRSKRSSSEPNPNDTHSITPPRNTCKSESDNLEEYYGFPKTLPFMGEQNHQIYSQSSSLSTPIRRLTSSEKLKSRAHLFCIKTLIRREKCLPCGGIIRFYSHALKCQGCKVTCHPECKDKVPLPCVPSLHTPTGKGIMGSISDYTPTSPPMIPALIVHCVNEIESRGLNEVGLYRVPGSEREVKELKEKFMKGKGFPNLSRVDIHAICGTVKEFLRSLREPLIPRSLWKDFVQASELKNEDEGRVSVRIAVNQLPQPNRDTLAFLILHLQRIAESPNCKMPIENLARVFGPTIVGFSNADPPESHMLQETALQYKVMSLLLKISSDYWNGFVSEDTENIFQTFPKTPEPIPAPEGNMLGPLSSGGNESRFSKSRVKLGKTPMTPRNTHTGTIKQAKRQFFQSPLPR